MLYYRNVLVGDGLHCVTADLVCPECLLYKDDSYYEMSSNCNNSKLPFKWMAPEACNRSSPLIVMVSKYTRTFSTVMINYCVLYVELQNKLF